MILATLEFKCALSRTKCFTFAFMSSCTDEVFLTAAFTNKRSARALSNFQHFISSPSPAIQTDLALRLALLGLKPPYRPPLTAYHAQPLHVASHIKVIWVDTMPSFMHIA
jgi:hypothetical protein